MPELPEVETIVREMRPKMMGKYIEGMVIRPKFTKRILQGVTPQEFYEKAIGQTIATVVRKGKYIILPLENSNAIILHLGMTGKVVLKNLGDLTFDERLLDDTYIDKHTHFIMDIISPWEEEGDIELHFNDVRMFGKVWLAENVENPEEIPLLKSLGPDALGISMVQFDKALCRKRPIKSLLLDQSLVAGIGNIYADEALFSAKIHPTTKACDLPDAARYRLWFAIKSVLKEGIKYKGSSVSDYSTTDGTEGSFQKHHRVYRREGLLCFDCGSSITRIKIAGRSTHFCPVCQAEGVSRW